MEHWLSANWWFLLTILVIVIGAYFRFDANEKRLDKHVDPENPAPHPNCPVHTTQFRDMGNTLEKIDKRLETLDKRIYGYMRSNGYRENAEAEE